MMRSIVPFAATTLAVCICAAAPSAHAQSAPAAEPVAPVVNAPAPAPSNVASVVSTGPVPVSAPIVRVRPTPRPGLGLIVGGSVTLAGSGFGLLIATPLIIVGAAGVQSGNAADPGLGPPGEGLLIPGIVTGLLSAGALAGGIAMIVIGIRRNDEAARGATSRAKRRSMLQWMASALPSARGGQFVFGATF